MRTEPYSDCYEDYHIEKANSDLLYTLGMDVNIDYLYPLLEDKEIIIDVDHEGDVSCHYESFRSKDYIMELMCDKIEEITGVYPDPDDWVDTDYEGWQQHFYNMVVGSYIYLTKGKK